MAHSQCPLLPHTTLFVEPQAQPEHKQQERKSTGFSGLPRGSPGISSPTPTLPQVLQEPRCSSGSSGPRPCPTPGREQVRAC